jgi:UDP-glucose 6-dehydrogenase
MKIAIAGVGVVGGALYGWLAKHTDHDLFRHDPGKGFNEIQAPVGGKYPDLDAVFICVPVPTTKNQEQDLSAVREVITYHCRPDVPVFIRSSVTPGTCDTIARMTGSHVFAMPEFLTERTAAADFESQNLICGAPCGFHTEHYVLLKKIFNGRKDPILMSNVEAELAKYMHNGNGTVKVHFNNLIYQLASKLGADYDRVRFGALMSGYICENHTEVPGPDGLLGYGGKCFPKDMEALIGVMDQNNVPCESLRAMQEENRSIRSLSRRAREVLR